MSFWVIFGPVAPPAAAINDFHPAVETVRDDVPVVEKRVLLEADIHEGGFEAVFEIAHLAFEDAADQAFFCSSFDSKLLKPPLLGHGDAGFERLGVDDDFLVGFLDRLDQALDFLDQGGCGSPDGFHDPLWLFLDGHRLKPFLFLCRGGRCERAARGNCLCRRQRPGAASVGNPSGGRPAAMFSARSISCACRCS